MVDDPYRQVGVSGDTEQIYRDLIECGCYKILAGSTTTLEYNDDKKRTGVSKLVYQKYTTTKKPRKQVSKKVRVKLVKERGGICEECEEDMFDNVHHADGDPTNDDESNLMLLCYKCHKRRHGKE